MKTLSLTMQKRELEVLLYACPMGEPLNECVLNMVRKLMNKNYHHIVESFDNEKIPSIIYEHEKCIYARIENKHYAQSRKINNNVQNIIVRLIWTGKGKLDFLSLELIKRKWIKSQNNFLKLFNNDNIDYKVYCDIRFIYELAYLFHRLKEEGMIRTVNSKGYFKVAEQHIVDYSGRKLSKNALAKISSKISKNPAKYPKIISEVEKIIKAIL